MIKPLIGITCGEIQNKIEPWSPITYGQSRTYIDAIIRAGGVPLLLPLCDDEAVLRRMYDMCDGLLLAGGNDIDPALYGQEPLAETTDVSVRRDAQENLLLDWTLADDKPLLGICRGMQLLNAKLGGTLYQDIATLLPEAEDHEASTRAKSLTHSAHTLSIAPNSKLSTAVGTTTIETNSHHHQAIQDVATALRASAWSEDGLIEALEDPTRAFMIGLQSHPESLVSTVPGWGNVFESFVEAAASSDGARGSRRAP